MPEHDSPEQVDERSNAFLPSGGESVRSAAHGPLAGLRLAVKDVFDVEGMPTRAGAPAYGNGSATSHASVVAALLAAGATYVGKTCTDELAFSLVGANKHYPRPRNWAAPDRFTGGSSSGSVSAVGANEADIALGTDTGGSIRAPACFCGLIGLRTSFGRIPIDGCAPLAPSFDTVGWFCSSPEIYRRTTEFLYGQLGGTDERAWRWCRCPPLEEFLKGPAERDEFERMSAIVSKVVDRESAPLALGVDPEKLYWAFRRIQAVEAWTMHGSFVEANGAGMNDDVRDRFEWANGVSDRDFGDAFALRRSLMAWLHDELGSDRVLIVPTTPSAAPLLDATPGELSDMREKALHLLCLAGLAGLPQLTLPLGSIEGAPFGLSLIGPRGSDVDLLKLGLTILDAGEAQQAVASR